MKQVQVHAVGFGLGGGDGDPVFAGVPDQLATGFKRPFPPRRDDGDIGIDGCIRQFEPDLVVSFSRGAVAHGLGLFLSRDFDLAPGNQWTRDRSAQQIRTLVYGISAEHGKHVVLDERFPEILHVDFRRPHGHGLVLDGLEIFPLAEVRAEGDDVGLVFRPEPLQDDRGIEPARIGQDDFADRVGLR